jgi:hypothetical protein
VLDCVIVDGIEVQHQRAKEPWIKKRDRWLFHLGLQIFQDELHRCVDEFYNEMERTWGFLPSHFIVIRL